MKFFKKLASFIGTGARAFVALVGVTGISIGVANYSMTQGSGTDFGSAVVSSVHYAKQLICDLTTPATQCATVKAGNTMAAADVAVAVADKNLQTAVEAPIPACATSPCTQVIGAFTQFQGTTALSATNPSFAAPIPTTAGGLSNYNVQPGASDNHVVIKAGAGQVYKIEAFNNSATVNYVRLYNATTGFNGCNSATNLVWQGIIPASTSGAGLSSSWDLGIAFATGISICVTSGYAQTDTTNATASALIVNVGYK